MRRRARTVAALAAVCMLAATAGCSGEENKGSTAKPDKVKILTGFGQNGHEAFFWVGIDKGFYREEGLDISKDDIIPGSGTDRNLQQLLGGAADFAVLDMAGAIAAYAGGPSAKADDRMVGFAIISALHQQSLSAVATLEGYGITTPRDLAGKTIGYTPGGTNYTYFPAYAQLAGIDVKTIKWVPMPPQQLLPALASHRVDAATQVVVGKPRIEATAKRPAILFPYSDYWTDVYGNGLGVTRKLAFEKPDLVRRVNRAVLRSLQYTVEHPDEAAQIFVKYATQFKPETVAAELRLLAPYVTPAAGQPWGGISEEKMAKSIAIAESLGVIGMSLLPSEVVHFDMVPQGS